MNRIFDNQVFALINFGVNWFCKPDLFGYMTIVWRCPRVRRLGLLVFLPIGLAGCMNDNKSSGQPQNDASQTLSAADNEPEQVSASIKVLNSAGFDLEDHILVTDSKFYDDLRQFPGLMAVDFDQLQFQGSGLIAVIPEMDSADDFQLKDLIVFKLETHTFDLGGGRRKPSPGDSTSTSQTQPTDDSAASTTTTTTTEGSARTPAAATSSKSDAPTDTSSRPSQLALVDRITTAHLSKKLGPGKLVPKGLSSVLAKEVFGPETDRKDSVPSYLGPVIKRTDVTVDGGKLVGIKLVHKDHSDIANAQRKVVLYLGGSGGSAVKNYCRPLAGFLLDAPGHYPETEVRAYDYPGFGDSPGQPSEKALYEAGQQAFDQLISEGYKPENIVIYGYSLGASVASNLALTDPRVKVIVIDRPMTSLVDGVQSGGLIKVVGQLSAMALGKFDGPYHLADLRSDQSAHVLNVGDEMAGGIKRLQSHLQQNSVPVAIGGAASASAGDNAKVQFHELPEGKRLNHIDSENHSNNESVYREFDPVFNRLLKSQ